MLIFQRRDNPEARDAWLRWMCIIFWCEWVTLRVPALRREICAAYRNDRKFTRSFCDGCRFYPGDMLRRGERERSDGLRECLGGELMEFHCVDYGEDLIGWRREGCSRREKGVPEPEPALPSYPWFQFIRHREGYEIRLRTEHGSTNVTREVGRGLRTIAEARPAAAEWARRQKIAFVEQQRDWMRW